MGRSSGDDPVAYAVSALSEPLEEAGPLFTFVGAFLPPSASAGWGARASGRLIGAVLLQAVGANGFIHGPVLALGGATALGGAAEGEPTVMDNGAASVSEPAGAAAKADRSEDRKPAREDPIDIAAALLNELLARSTAAGVDTLFTRPQGLDRLWVRAGFIPVPEVELPLVLRGCPGLGLFAWRGGSAIWSAAGRAAAAAVAAGEGAAGRAGRGGRRRTR